MRVRANIVLGVVAAAVGAAPAAAQRDQTVFPLGRFMIDGVQATCGDTPVAIGGPVFEGPIMVEDDSQIVINPALFDPLPTNIKLFVYYYTCSSITFEGDPAQIDAYTVSLGARRGWLTAAELDLICNTDLLTTTGWPEAPDADHCTALRADLAGMGL